MNRKKVIVCILALVDLLISTTNVLAMNLNGENNDTPSIDVDDENNILKDEENKNQQKGNNLSQNLTINNNGTGTIKDGNAMPNTGIEDLPIIAIGVCIISAAVAYTQIRKYNV